MPTTDWETRYRTGNTPWDKGTAAPPLVEMLEERGADLFLNGPVLVPGCGLGYDVRALATKGVTAIGVDLAETAVRRAREEFSPAGNEQYELGDFLDPKWREGREFAAIWEHTCFCAIDPGLRPVYAEAAAGLLGEGGILAGVFFLNPFDPDEEAVGPPFGTTITELESHLAPWFERVEGWVPGRAYPGREGREWVGIFRKLSNRIFA